MKRTTVDGQTLNVRTADMLALWQFNCLTDFLVVQGSYNAGGVQASAGTHDGGGALDLSVFGWTASFKDFVVRQGRLAGFADWHRVPSQGPWGEHIHAIAIGDPELSQGARQQVVEYRQGQDGLADHGRDDGPRVVILLYPHTRLKKVSLLSAWAQFRVKTPKSRASVARIQWVLNEKLGTNLVVDGVAGKKTRDAYKIWENRVGGKRANGIPGRFSLGKLGEGRFVPGVIAWEKHLKHAAVSKSAQYENEKKNPTFKK